jgi:3-oxoacyl-[acyl-carrier protein] reductase
MLASLQGRRALVTGGTRGIGLGIATVLAEAGASVVVTGRDEGAGAAAVAVLREFATATIGFVAADAASRDDANLATAEAVELLGGLDIVVANAGGYPEATLDELGPTEVEAMLATNLGGTIHTVAAALAPLRASDAGRVVVISSITGPVTGLVGLSHYGAAKAGQLGFVRSAALELAPDRITINAVCPGNIATEGLVELGDDYLATMLAAIPLGRLGDPRDIGTAVAFLCSTEAGFITGQSLVVDGGQVLPEARTASQS